MSGPLERISIGNRINRPPEAEVARLTWAEDCCELVISALCLLSRVRVS